MGKPGEPGVAGLRRLVVEELTPKADGRLSSEAVPEGDGWKAEGAGLSPFIENATSGGNRHASFVLRMKPSLGAGKRR